MVRPGTVVSRGKVNTEGNVAWCGYGGVELNPSSVWGSYLSELNLSRHRLHCTSVSCKESHQSMAYTPYQETIASNLQTLPS